VKIDQIEKNDIIVNRNDNQLFHLFVKKSSFTVSLKIKKYTKCLLFHNFSILENFKDKNFFLVRKCDYCQRRFYFNVCTHACTMCDYTLCQRDECKIESEKSLCLQQKGTSLKSSPNYTTNKQKFIYNISNNSFKHNFYNKCDSSSCIRKYFILKNISEQIIPVNQISPLSPHGPRNRSFSNPEVKLDNFNFQVII
jgi:hypothetical protein